MVAAFMSRLKAWAVASVKAERLTPARAVRARKTRWAGGRLKKRRCCDGWLWRVISAWKLWNA